MRYVFSAISASLGALLLSTAVLAHEAKQTNVFNAETSNPDLASVIKAFEQTCMPFVLHQTELTHDNNKRHMSEFIQSRGFIFEKSIVDEPIRLSLGPKGPSTSKRQKDDNLTSKPTSFTVYDGTSSKDITSSRVIVTQTGEIVGPARTERNWITVEKEQVFYTHETESRLRLGLTWSLVLRKEIQEKTALSALLRHPYLRQILLRVL